MNNQQKKTILICLMVYLAFILAAIISLYAYCRNSRAYVGETAGASVTSVSEDGNSGD